MGKLRGVNLGGWLVLEKWITPSLFKGALAQDEYEFCKQLGDKKIEKLHTHRSSWITEADFIWMKDRGINALRLPVPHWAFGGIDPYVGCVDYVDWLFDISDKYNFKVLIDLHTAPGSQNGHDHSGRKGGVAWHKDPDNIDQTLEVIGKLAERYGNRKSLWGIELLNEPSDKIPHELLLDFYKRGYERVRNFCNEPIAVVVSDAYRPNDWSNSFDSSYKSVFMDVHLYQVFSEADRRRGIHGNLKVALREWGDLIIRLQEHIPVIVGEWSVSLQPRAFRGMDIYERDKAEQAYATVQLKSFEQAAGWFYWTYKTENTSGWSMVDCVRRGWLPSQLDKAVSTETTIL